MTTIHKSFRYRVYPQAEQEARLNRWQSALRFLWNLALEQRKIGLARTDKKYPTAFDQINELTDLRQELPWLADVPRNVCAQFFLFEEESDECRGQYVPLWNTFRVLALGAVVEARHRSEGNPTKAS